MTATLADLPFLYLYMRLDAPEKPLFRSSDKGKGKPSLLVGDEFLPAVEQFGKAIAAKGQGFDGVLAHEGVRCRITPQKTADGGSWVCARRLSASLPELDKLGFASHIFNHLHGLGTRDGLILISGTTGQGKTTTAVGLLLDYLKTYGGAAIGIEETCEFELKGRHGASGVCFQIEAKSDEDWENSFERAMRWAPRIIFAGEVRTPKVAAHLLRAATTGHTVITTINACSPEDALICFLSLAEQAMGPSSAELLSSGLTALLHQHLREEGPFIRYLFTEENAPGDPIRSVIRENKINALSTYMDRISARLANQPGASALPPISSSSLPPLPKRS